MRAFNFLTRIFLQVFVLAAIASCGGGGGGEPDHPPSISNLTYSPSTARQALNGTVTINGTVNFADSGGDITALHMLTSAGSDLTIPTPTLNGITSGTGAAAFVVSVDTIGKYTFEVWATDSRGSASNRLSGSFEVLPQETPNHPPSISNLVYSPSTTLQAPNGTIKLTGTIDFADAGGDVSALHMVSSAGADLTVETPFLSGITAGSVVGEFIVSVNEIGTYTFEVWMTDNQGSVSNRLSGTFEVVPDDSGANWTRLDASPQNILLGITRNSVQYMAVGMGGTVMTSPDLSNWTARNSGVIHTLRSVASSGSRFVAVGDSAIGEPIVISSTDGLTWSVQYRGGSCGPDTCASPSKLSGVIWTGTQFIAVGQEIIYPGGTAYALILTSPDGLNWTQHAVRAIVLGAGSESGMTSVAWSGNLLVAVGISGDGYPAAWSSTDAEVWTLRAVPGYAGQNLRDITWGNGRFVAVGWGGVPAVFTSSDGINWRGNSGDASLPAMNAVTTGVTNYLAVSNTYREVSADGLTWTLIPSPDCGNDVLWDGLRYVSVGGSICRSP